MGIHASGDTGPGDEPPGAAGGGAGLAELGAGAGLGVRVGTGLGAASRRSAAESGEVLLGAAATSTDLMPNQAMPTVTTVATAHAIK